jgi:hypothetical protein
MPRIDEILGVIFVINNGREHPPPHVHVKYNEYEACFDLRNGNLIEGKLPGRALKIAKDWVRENGREALKQWENMEKGEKILPKSKWAS